MLTEGQIKYLETIPDDQKVVVKPWDPKGLEIANQVMTEIKTIKPDLEIMLLGSLPLKISGQEDIDISVFCVKSEQPKHLDSFKLLKNNPDLLKEYERIKEEAKVLPYKEYQRRKYEFYNKILGIG